ncbi:hypothetical protein KAR91_74935 [Candidatus Pacearchaeota archaeon]|nr:hypothetical protein [Candidatus Pacearchaeota archaeon]
MKYYLDRNVIAAFGTQTFVVDADSLEKAKKKFLSGESDIEYSEVEVTKLDEYDFDEIYTD